jgi:hypothetical protein
MLGHETTEFSEVIAWSPTRDLLAYAIGRPPYSNTDLYALDPTTGEDRMLFSTGSGEHDRIVSDLAWSPSGRWLAVAIESEHDQEDVRSVRHALDALQVVVLRSTLLPL